MAHLGCLSLTRDISIDLEVDVLEWAFLRRYCQLFALASLYNGGFHE